MNENINNDKAELKYNDMLNFLEACADMSESHEHLDEIQQIYSTFRRKLDMYGNRSAGLKFNNVLCMPLRLKIQARRKYLSSMEAVLKEAYAIKKAQMKYRKKHPEVEDAITTLGAAYAAVNEVPARVQRNAFFIGEAGSIPRYIHEHNEDMQ